MRTNILLPDGTYINMPVVPLPTQEVEEAQVATAQKKTMQNADDKGFHLLEKARTGAGSTAAAGSDFFYIYRRMRAKEMARLDKMDEEQQEIEFENALHDRREKRIREALEKTAKKAAKRKRAKQKLADRKRGRGQANKAEPTTVPAPMVLIKGGDDAAD